MGFRTVCASIVCKSTYRLLRLMKRGGTSLPGKLALKVDPNYLNTLAEGVRTLVLTGTNGKTTSTHIVAQALENMGEQAFYNRSGANLIQGITTEFAIRSSIGGKPRYKLAVIECDEGALRRVCAAVDPEVLVVTNVFRDQLDRYGEVTHTLENIMAGVKNSPHATLCLNADDSMVASIADRVDNDVVFYGVDCETTPNASRTSRMRRTASSAAPSTSTTTSPTRTWAVSSARRAATTVPLPKSQSSASSSAGATVARSSCASTTTAPSSTSTFPRATTSTTAHAWWRVSRRSSSRASRPSKR